MFSGTEGNGTTRCNRHDEPVMGSRRVGFWPFDEQRAIPLLRRRNRNASRGTSWTWMKRRSHRHRDRAGQRPAARHEQPVAQPTARRGGHPRPVPHDPRRRPRATWSGRFGSRSGGRGLVVVGGGLGPTQDDLTREALATVAGVPLVEDPGSLAAIEAMFARRNRAMPDRNRVQALTPEGAEGPANRVGTAPGIWMNIERGDRRLPARRALRDEGDVRRAGRPPAPRQRADPRPGDRPPDRQPVRSGRVGHRGRRAGPDGPRPPSRGRHLRPRRDDQLPRHLRRAPTRPRPSARWSRPWR